MSSGGGGGGRRVLGGEGGMRSGMRSVFKLS